MVILSQTAFTAQTSSSSLLVRRVLAAATAVLARAHTLRDKAVAARRVVEKLQDAGGGDALLVSWEHLS